ncbi:MAG: hypothetical protein [Olavius algarvensis Gamma 1 endosymbiont]|nr:MAG: hypothetical protein [Olavius algarvensis Gamma 1 endosymbiont]
MHTYLLVIPAIITTATCMAQPPVTDVPDEVIDCTEITTSLHLDACVRQELAASNARLLDELASFERRTESDYTSVPSLGKELIEKVHKTQEAWTVFRDLNCRVAVFQVEEGKPAYITLVNDCIIRMNAERIEELSKLP